MQTRKQGYLHGKLALSTHTKGKLRAEPVWEMRYRLPSGKQSDKVLGKAWLKTSRPPEGYLTQAQAQAAMQTFLDEHATVVPESRKTFARSWTDFLATKEKIKRPLRGSTLDEYNRIYAVLAKRPWKNGLTWAERPVATFEPDDVTAVYDELEDRELAASSTNHYRSIVRHIIGTHITRDWPFLCEQTEESTGKLRFYDVGQVTALKVHAHDDRDRAIYTLATETGPRMSEILALKVGNVDFDPEVNRVRLEDGYTAKGGHGATKGHQVRSVPMSDNVRLALLPFCQGRPSDALVFADVLGDPLCGGSLYRRFKSAAARAGLPDIRFHDLRHSFGTRAIRVFNIYEVQRMMGHKSITTTERYLHYAPDPEGAAKLSSLWEVAGGAQVLAFGGANRGGRPAAHPGACPKCGEPKAPGQSYCVAHMAAYRQAS